MNEIKFKDIVLIFVLVLLSGTIYFLRNKLTLEKAFNDSLTKTSEQLVQKFGQDVVLQVIQGNAYPDLARNFPKRKYTQIVLFEPSSCGTCLNENVLWSVIDKEYVPVIGIIRHSNPEEIRPYLQNAEIAISALHDRNSSLFSRFSSYRFPLKILVNEKGHIVMVDEVRPTVELQEEYLKTLEYVIQR